MTATEGVHGDILYSVKSLLYALGFHLGESVADAELKKEGGEVAAEPDYCAVVGGFTGDSGKRGEVKAWAFWVVFFEDLLGGESADHEFLLVSFLVFGEGVGCDDGVAGVDEVSEGRFQAVALGADFTEKVFRDR